MKVTKNDLVLRVWPLAYEKKNVRLYGVSSNFSQISFAKLGNFGGLTKCEIRRAARLLGRS